MSRETLHAVAHHSGEVERRAGQLAPRARPTQHVKTLSGFPKQDLILPNLTKSVGISHALPSTATVGQPALPSTARGAGATAQPSPYSAEHNFSDALRFKHSQRSQSSERRAPLPSSVPPRLPEISLGRWVLLSSLLTLVATLSTVAFLGEVEAVSEARGVLRGGIGALPVKAQGAGVIEALQAQPGHQVEAGQTIARIDSTSLSAAVERNDRQLKLAREEAQRVSVEGRSYYEGFRSAQQQKKKLLKKRLSTKRKNLRQLRVHRRRMRKLATEGLALEVDALAAAQSANVLQEDLLLIEQQMVEIDAELADRKRLFEETLQTKELAVQRAEVQLAEANELATLSDITSPENGTLESLLVSKGQLVQAGEVVAQVVPEGDTSSVVVFAPSKDAPFLRPGQDAILEFDSLPVSEFGKAKGKVSRVATDRPLPLEVAQVLSVDASVDELVRVEVEILDSSAWQKMNERLVSGAHVTAHLQTRKRRIAALLFDFIR